QISNGVTLQTLFLSKSSYRKSNYIIFPEIINSNMSEQTNNSLNFVPVHEKRLNDGKNVVFVKSGSEKCAEFSDIKPILDFIEKEVNRFKYLFDFLFYHKRDHQNSTNFYEVCLSGYTVNENNVYCDFATNISVYFANKDSEKEI